MKVIMEIGNQVDNEQILKPGKHDVLFGRGGAINSHRGNKLFRKVVDDNKKDYMEVHKSDKPRIAARVVQIIRNLDPPGRFLAPVDDADRNSKRKDCTILWRDVGDKKARAKASQCLREKKQDVPQSSKLRARTCSDNRFYSRSIQNDTNLVSSRYPRSFDSVDRGNLPTLTRYDNHLVSERRCYRYPQDERNPYSHHYEYHPSYSQPATKQHYHNFMHQDPVTSTTHANSVTPNEKNHSFRFMHTSSKKIKREYDQDTSRSSWLGSFHSLESHMLDSSMSFSSPIMPGHVYNSTSPKNLKDFTVPSFVRPTSPAMSELTYPSRNGDEERH